jgi:hypothetical protein
MESLVYPKALESKAEKSDLKWHASQASIVDVTGSVRSITGEAYFSQDGVKWEKLNEGKTLTEGNRIKTASNSFVNLTLTPLRVAVRLDDNSELSFKKTKSISIKKENDANALSLSITQGKLLIANNIPSRNVRCRVITVLGCVEMDSASECSISFDNEVHCSSGAPLVLEVHCLVNVNKLSKNKSHIHGAQRTDLPVIIDTPKEKIKLLKSEFKTLGKYLRE